MMKKLTMLFAFAMLAFSTPMMTACDNDEGAFEQMGEDVDEAAEEVGDEIDDATTD